MRSVRRMADEPGALDIVGVGRSCSDLERYSAVILEGGIGVAMWIREQSAVRRFVERVGWVSGWPGELPGAQTLNADRKVSRSRMQSHA